MHQQSHFSGSLQTDGAATRTHPDGSAVCSRKYEHWLHSRVTAVQGREGVCGPPHLKVYTDRIVME